MPLDNAFETQLATTLVPTQDDHLSPQLQLPSEPIHDETPAYEISKSKIEEDGVPRSQVPEISTTLAAEVLPTLSSLPSVMNTTSIEHDQTALPQNHLPELEQADPSRYPLDLAHVSTQPEASTQSVIVFDFAQPPTQSTSPASTIEISTPVGDSDGVDDSKIPETAITSSDFDLVPLDTSNAETSDNNVETALGGQDDLASERAPPKPLEPEVMQFESSPLDVGQNVHLELTADDGRINQTDLHFCHSVIDDEVLRRDDAILSRLIEDSSDNDHDPPHDMVQETSSSGHSNMDGYPITDEYNRLSSPSISLRATLSVQIHSVEQQSAALATSESIPSFRNKSSKVSDNQDITRSIPVAIEVSDDANITAQQIIVNESEPLITKRVTWTSPLNEQYKQSISKNRSTTASRGFVDLDPEEAVETTSSGYNTNIQHGRKVRTHLPESKNNDIKTTNLIKEDEMDEVDQVDFSMSRYDYRSNSRRFEKEVDEGYLFSKVDPARQRDRKPPGSLMHVQGHCFQQSSPYANENTRYDNVGSRSPKAKPRPSHGKRKRSEPEEQDLEYSERAPKKTRRSNTTRSSQDKGVLTKTDLIEVSDGEDAVEVSDDESEEDVVALKPMLPHTSNEFPRYSSGDVCISLGNSHEYRLHSQILQLRSQWFKEALKLTPKEASNTCLQECDEAMAKGFRQKSKVKFRFEILGHPSNMQLTRATFTTTIGRVGSKSRGNEKDSSQTTGMQNLEVSEDNENSLHGSNSDTKSIEVAIMRAYDNLFRIFYGVQLNISTKCINTAITQVQNLMKAAKRSGCFLQVRPHALATFMYFGREAYQHAANDPKSLLSIAIQFRCAPLFKECAIHIIGNYPKWQENIIDSAVFSMPLRAFFKKKVEDLRSLIARIDDVLSNSNLAVNGEIVRVVDSEAYKVDCWLVVKHWHDWFAKMRRRVVKADQLDGTMYRLMHEGGDAYMDLAETFAVIERVRNKELKGEEKYEVECDLEKMKEFAAMTVRPLLVNNSMLCIADAGIKHLTCIEIMDEELPWNLLETQTS